MSVSSLFLSGIAVLSLLGGAQAGIKYTLDVEYSGDNFFDGFSFFQGADPTHGFVNYVDQATAVSEKLIYVDGSGAVHIGVDSKTILDPTGVGRDSVRITTNQAFNHGLFILDLNNMPGGVCGTWPAWWAFGPNWPASGSMDIIEGVNSRSSNLMSLQTAPNCTIAGSFETGTLQTNNCDEAATYGVGCGVSDNQPASYGLEFNANNGGIYATEWTSDYIRIWFFPRGSTPADITAGTPDPSTWGTPDTNFQGDCDIDSHFVNNNFVFDTTFCGDWAGSVWSTDPVCSTLAPTCQDYVAANPGAFSDMYWAINSVKIYTAAAQTTSSSSTSSTSSSTSSTSSSTSSTSSSTSSTSSTSSSTSSTSTSTSSTSTSASSSSQATTSTASSTSSPTPSISTSTSSTPTSASSSSSQATTSTVSKPSSSSGGATSTSSKGSVTIPTATSSTPLLPPTSSSLNHPLTSSSSGTGPITTSAPSLTTSTVFKTSVYTITSCASTVTDCPARLGSVTTDIITQYTTFCPFALTSAVPQSSVFGIHSPVVSYTTVIVTSYVDVCPEGTLSTYSVSQTQIVYENVPGVTSSAKPAISMVTTVKTVGTETVTVTVPYSYPSTTPVSASATPKYVAGNATVVSTTGAAIPKASQFEGMSSGSVRWSQGVVFASLVALLMIL